MTASRAAPALRIDPALALCGLGVCTVLILFWSSFASMGQVWMESDTYAHCVLVPVISLWLLWQRRTQLLTLRAQPTVTGLVLISILSLVWFIADAIQIGLISHLASVALLPATVLAVLGWPALKRLAFPLGFLVFMVPFGDSLIPALQSYTTAFIVHSLHVLDIPVFNEGTLIHLTNGSFEVAEACAGLRFLIAMLVIAALFAHMTYHTWRPTILFMTLAVIVPVIMNGFRALSIVLIGYWSDHRLAVDIDHIIFGWVFLSLVMFAVLGIGLLLRERTQPAAPAPKPRPVAATASAAGAGTALALAVAVMAIGPGLGWAVQAATATAGSVTIQAPSQVDGRLLQDAATTWRPDFKGPDAETLVSYGGDTRRPIDFYVAYYGVPNRDGKAVSGINRLAREPDWTEAGYETVRLVIGGQGMVVDAVRLAHSSGERRLAARVYWINGAVTARPIFAKALQLWSLVRTLTQPTAVFVVSATFDDTPAEAAAAMAEFTNALPELGTLFQHP